MATLAKISTDLTCYHCGDQVVSASILFAGKNFCCQGCQTVFEILDQNQLSDYYTLSQNPGLSLKNQTDFARFDYLSDEQVIAKLVDFKDEKFTRITFLIPQMHCSSCIWLLENLYKLHAGISASRVNFMKKEVAISFYQQEISLQAVVMLLAKIGYEPAITLANEEKKETKTNKKLYYQLGIAGFCFGNVMLLSLPDYFDFTGDFHKTLGQHVGYLMIVLSLPVLVYSDLDYLKSAYRGFQQRIMNLDVPISLGIVALFGVSLFEIFTHTGGGYLDSFTGLIFFLLLGKSFQQKTFDTLSFDRDYKSYFPISVTLKKNNVETTIPVNNLVKGNRILVHNNELVPADAILLGGKAMIDYSFVTGEAVPVAKVFGEIIYAGGRQVGEAIEMEVVKEVSQSYLTQLWNNEAFNKEKDSHLTSLVNRNSKRFTMAVLSIAFVAAIYWLTMADITTAVKVFASVLIIACPCALALSTPFTLGNAMRIFGKNKLYLKNASVIEDLAAIDTIVFDKTGTLTDASAANISFFGNVALDHYQAMLVKSLLRHSTHPLSQNVYKYIQAEVTEVFAFEETVGKGLCAQIDGHEVKIGSSTYVHGSKLFSEQTAVYIAIDGQLLGYYALTNAYRTGIETLISNLKGKYRLFVLSGDHDREMKTLQAIFGENTPIYFNQTPADKLEFVAAQKQLGHRVMMIGDGLNDAGALKTSDVGVSVTENISNFSPACDAILDANSFGMLYTFMRFALNSVNVIKACYAISLTYNIVGLTVAVQGQMSPVFAAIFMPLSSITVMLFTTFATNVLWQKRVCSTLNSFDMNYNNNTSKLISWK